MSPSSAKVEASSELIEALKKISGPDQRMTFMLLCARATIAEKEVMTEMASPLYREMYGKGVFKASEDMNWVKMQDFGFMFMSLGIKKYAPLPNRVKSDIFSKMGITDSLDTAGLTGEARAFKNRFNSIRLNYDFKTFLLGIEDAYPTMFLWRSGPAQWICYPLDAILRMIASDTIEEWLTGILKNAMKTLRDIGTTGALWSTVLFLVYLIGAFILKTLSERSLIAGALYVIGKVPRTIFLTVMSLPKLRASTTVYDIEIVAGTVSLSLREILAVGILCLLIMGLKNIRFLICSWVWRSDMYRRYEEEVIGCVSMEDMMNVDEQINRSYSNSVRSVNDKDSMCSTLESLDTGYRSSDVSSLKKEIRGSLNVRKIRAASEVRRKAAARVKVGVLGEVSSVRKSGMSRRVDDAMVDLQASDVIPVRSDTPLPSTEETQEDSLEDYAESPGMTAGISNKEHLSSGAKEAGFSIEEAESAFQDSAVGESGMLKEVITQAKTSERSEKVSEEAVGLWIKQDHGKKSRSRKSRKNKNSL